VKVFITGATGVLGRAVVRLLRARSATIVALVRDRSRATLLMETGGVMPVVLDLFDEDGLTAAAQGSDAILHLATRIPPLREWRHLRAWAENDRLRREGTSYLARVARRVGCPTLIYPSVTLVYPDRGCEWIDADHVPAQAARLTESTLDAECVVKGCAAQGGRGIILRLGPLYGPQSEQSRYILELARKGFSPFIAREEAYHPFTWIDDAAAAVIAALDRVPPGTYDIVDDEPLTIAEIRRALARAVGRRHVWRTPAWLLRYAMGVESASVGLRSRRVSNATFRSHSAWAPSVPSAWEGWQLIARELFQRNR
jgi:2-alkyl-3-oxoalkanoate reductase